MAVLTRAQIEQAPDVQTETVPVPEWGGDVLVRTLTGTERDAFEASLAANGGDRAMNLYNFRARLAALCLVDEAGKRLFTDADVALLGRKSARALDRVIKKARELNALDAAAIEGLEKNSVAGPDASSISA